MTLTCILGMVSSIGMKCWGHDGSIHSAPYLDLYSPVCVPTHRYPSLSSARDTMDVPDKPFFSPYVMNSPFLKLFSPCAVPIHKWPFLVTRTVETYSSASPSFVV